MQLTEAREQHSVEAGHTNPYKTSKATFKIETGPEGENKWQPTQDD